LFLSFPPQLQEIRENQTRLPEDGFEGSFSEFPVVGNSQPPVGREAIAQDQVAAGLMVKLIANLGKNLD
jgi:hypothetical protein